MDSVADYVRFSPDELFEKLAQVGWGLIRGVAFLHELYIAHRDIKPHNLVVDKDFCLKIIDFDIAMRVKNEDEEVNDQCGTHHWIAPEIEQKLMYSPIKADRWSTGRVLLYLVKESEKEEEQFMTIARKLMAPNPKRRPSILDVAASLPDVDNAANESRASRTRKDRVEGDEETAKPPSVKRRRLSDNEGVFADLHEPQVAQPMVCAH
jgi:hypothetical protein